MINELKKFTFKHRSYPLSITVLALDEHHARDILSAILDDANDLIITNN